MFSHIVLGSSDIERSRVFYDAIFRAIGAKPAIDDPWGRLMYQHHGGKLVITKPIDGTPVTTANGSTIGFTMETAGQADAWHEAGTASGGTPIEDPPGLRATQIGDFYLAYLRDPDGNKLCAQYALPPSPMTLGV